MEKLFSQALVYIAVLTVIVNIITEVFKAITKCKDEGKINFFVTIISIILTELTGIIYLQNNPIEFQWYLIIVFAIAGMIVAYAAMFGYDKLLSCFKGIGVEVK